MRALFLTTLVLAAACTVRTTEPGDNRAADVAERSQATAPTAPAASAEPSLSAGPVRSGPGSLAATRWRVAAINGRATPAEQGYRIEFDRYRPGEVVGGFGCNSFQGPWSQNGDHVTFGSIVATEMACGDPAGRFEREGFAVLAKGVRAEFGGGRVRLVGEGGSIDLVPEPKGATAG